MNTQVQNISPILLTGDNQLTVSVAVCLLNAGHQTHVLTHNPAVFRERINKCLALEKEFSGRHYGSKKLFVESEFTTTRNFELVIAITPENIEAKKKSLSNLIPFINAHTIVAINMEGMDICELQASPVAPPKLIGLNWTDPAYNNLFLEIIVSQESIDAGDKVLEMAKNNWGKDPYLVTGHGIRSRLMAAMVREASFLVEGDYATVEDIDRACRNDAGYYLPFCGNCRYMDLMGTYAYGIVMKDLNPDLSKNKSLPRFINNLLNNSNNGMDSSKGFYDYNEADVTYWTNAMTIFSYQIHDIIKKYPFNHPEVAWD